MRGKTPPAILLRVHREFVREAQQVSDTAPMICALQEKFDLGAFCGSFEDTFGFEPARFERARNRGEFLELRVPIPPIERPTGRACGNCGGSGKDPEIRGDCLYCSKSGRESAISWETANATAASLAVFFMLADAGEDTAKTSSKNHQLFHVGSAIADGACPLWGSYAPAFMGWLSRFPVHTDFDEVIAAMREAYHFMFEENRRGSLRRMFRSSFRAILLHAGYLVLDCPGDACGLHPSDHGNTTDVECEFTCHNLDSPAQQLALLAGLAALHDRARREMGER